MAASTAGQKGLPPEVGGALAGLLEGPYGALFTGALLGRRVGWREALFSGLGWMGAGMPGGSLPMALWVGQGVLRLWERGGGHRALGVLAFLLGGLLFRGLWLAPLGVLLAERGPWPRAGHALVGFGVYGPWGVLAVLGAWGAERLGWNGTGGSFRGMDLPVFLYGTALLLRGMVLMLWS